MALSEAAAALLREVLAERAPLIEQATDLVYLQSPDLVGKRPRIVTRMLVERVFTCSEAALLHERMTDFDQFIDQVTGIRAEKDFHVSTLLSGFRSFRGGIAERLKTCAKDPWLAWEVLVAADDLFASTAMRAADLLVDRQHAALLTRKAQVEREKAELYEELRLQSEAFGALQTELAEAVATIDRLENERIDRTSQLYSLAEVELRPSDMLQRYAAELMGESTEEPVEAPPDDDEKSD